MIQAALPNLYLEMSYIYEFGHDHDFQGFIPSLFHFSFFIFFLFLFFFFFFGTESNLYAHRLGKNGYAFATFQVAVESIVLLGGSCTSEKSYVAESALEFETKTSS
jgi:hypothetical protein